MRSPPTRDESPVDPCKRTVGLWKHVPLAKVLFPTKQSIDGRGDRWRTHVLCDPLAAWGTELAYD